MSTSSEADDAVEIQGIKRVTVDGETTEMQSVDDQVKAANTKSKAVSAPGFGLGFQKIVPPGAQ